LDQDENCIEIKISDTTRGMREEKLKKAFKIPFTSKKGGKRFLDLLPVKK